MCKCLFSFLLGCGVTLLLVSLDLHAIYCIVCCTLLAYVGICVITSRNHPEALGGGIPSLPKKCVLSQTVCSLTRPHYSLKCNTAQSFFCICWSFQTIFNSQDIQISSLEPSVTFFKCRNTSNQKHVSPHTINSVDALTHIYAAGMCERWKLICVCINTEYISILTRVKTLYHPVLF